MNDKYIGKLLDNRYEILEVIGTGGMAVVYKALCHRLNRYVAVKILKEEYAKDEEFRNRFHAESHAVAMLSHPNIVAVYDVSRSNSIEYIVMELIDGMTLKQYMDRRGLLSQKEAIHFATQILRALSHAHSRGIIHRDIKPHNIMLLRDSTVRVADFGIARLESSQKTVTREAFGSVHYIAPEQAKGSKIDCRADIYSTGVVLYEMLTGRLPYEGDTPVSIAIQHINSLPLSPREINPDIPEALEKITMKAMASSLSKRYATTDEMIADLDAFRKDPHVDIMYDPPVPKEDDFSETKPIVLKREKEEFDDIDDSEFEKKRNEKKKDRLPMISTIIAGGIFLAGLVILLGTVFGWWKNSPKKKLETPEVIGMTIEEARYKYDDFEIIEPDESARETSDKYEEGVIMKQRPEAYSTNNTGKIYVTISRGKNDKIIKVPSLANMDEQMAKNMLERAGLRYRIEQENSDTVEVGMVIKSVPAEDSQLLEGDSVTIYISLGKEANLVEIPQVSGLSKEEAIKALESAKLAYKIEESSSSDTTVGLVIKTEPAIGTSVKEGDTVTVFVSRGASNTPPEEDAAMVVVPNILGMTESQAATTLESAKLKKGKVTYENSSTIEKGRVIRQGIAANQSRVEGASVGFTVSLGPKAAEAEKPASGSTVQMTREFRLPNAPQSFMVKITVNGETQYEKQHKDTDGSVKVTLKGKGDATICVYIDGVISQEIPMKFE